jgi:two-component system, cell cycle sensor histidine kinase and response regulator CckA
MTQVLAFPLLDTPPEEAFDRLTRLAARLLGAPVALVSLLGDDRVFFKSAIGLAEPWASCRSTPFSLSFCRHVVAAGEPLVVEDARRHPVVRTSQAIRELGWIAYAGVPLTLPDGRTVGALCVVDTLPRIWSARDVALLQDLAASVVTEIELRSPRSGLELVPGVTLPPPPAPPEPAAGIFDASALPMGLVLADGRWLRVNPALAELLGTTPAALAGGSAEASTHPADRAAEQEAMRLLRAGECPSYTLEKRLLREDGDLLWVVATVSAMPDELGEAGQCHVALQDITDRKRAELELRRREERYRLAAETTQDAVWDWDLLTDRLVWNEPAGGIFGYPRPDFDTSAAWWYERLHADERERVLSGMHAAIARGSGEWSHEHRFRRGDGTYVQVRDRARIVRDEAGDAVRMVGALHDVSDRARAELLARGQSRLLEQIAAGLDLDAVLERVIRFAEAHGSDLLAAVTVLDREVGALRLAAAPSFPAALREVLAWSLVEPAASAGAVAAARRERVVFPDLAADASAESWRAPLLVHGLRAVWSTPLFGTDGSLLGTLDVHYREPRAPADADLSLVEAARHLAEIAIERGRSEEALARGTRVLEQVLDSLPVGVWVLDREGRVMYGNPAGRAIWGGARYVSLEEYGAYRGWRPETGEAIAPEEWAAARAIRTGETTLNEIVQIETFDGVPKTIANSAVPLRSLDGSIEGAIILDEDITERRAAEEALRRSEERLRHVQKMEAVGQLAGGVAHDFNNLLTGILSYSDLVLQELRPGDPLRGDLEQIRHAGERAAALTRQLLAFSRRQVLQPRVLSLNACVTELDSMLRRLVGTDVSLETALEPGLWYVLADAGQLEDVLVNLVVNAREATPPGGRVTITTANLQLDANGIRPGPYVTLSVSDNGVGMDVQTQARIFEPFFTTKRSAKGTGLGLSTVYGIVEQSGGHITVESAPGQGSTFTIFLPSHAGPALAEAGEPDPRALPRGHETLLLVEDEASVRSSARRLLERHGYTVIEARHGAEALRIMEEGGRQVDLVLTDLVMPEMGGREMVERLRARHPGIKVLFMSGYSERAVAQGGVMPPGTGFMEKPFTVEQLTRRTREILDG